jgi:VanZ family protein
MLSLLGPKLRKAAAQLRYLPRTLALVWAAAVPLGVALEFAQRLVPGRSFEVGHMIANTLGVCAGPAVAAALRVGKVRAA